MVKTGKKIPVTINTREVCMVVIMFHVKIE